MSSLLLMWSLFQTNKKKQAFLQILCSECRERNHHTDIIFKVQTGECHITSQILVASCCRNWDKPWPYELDYRLYRYLDYNTGRCTRIVELKFDYKLYKQQISLTFPLSHDGIESRKVNYFTHRCAMEQVNDFLRFSVLKSELLFYSFLAIVIPEYNR